MNCNNLSFESTAIFHHNFESFQHLQFLRRTWTILKLYLWFSFIFSGRASKKESIPVFWWKRRILLHIWGLLWEFMLLLWRLHESGLFENMWILLMRRWVTSDRYFQFSFLHWIIWSWYWAMSTVAARLSIDNKVVAVICIVKHLQRGTVGCNYPWIRPEKWAFNVFLLSSTSLVDLGCWGLRSFKENCRFRSPIWLKVQSTATACCMLYIHQGKTKSLS